MPQPSLLAALLFGLAATATAQDQVVVFAAASLTNVLKDLGSRYETASGVKVVTSFAGASTLAKQIENGAPADVFMSADAAWMDYLVNAKQIDVSSRIDLVGNRVVLVAPKDKPFPVTVDQGFAFAQAFTSRFAVGDPASVPIGRYTKEAFTNLGWWDGIKDRIAATADVRATLKLVESGEVDAGAVYATDAASSTRVTVLATIPVGLHQPVVHPLALTANAKPPAAAFVAYLRSDAAKAVFVGYGFTWLASR